MKALSPHYHTRETEWEACPAGSPVRNRLQGLVTTGRKEENLDSRLGQRLGRNRIGSWRASQVIFTRPRARHRCVHGSDNIHELAAAASAVTISAKTVIIPLHSAVLYQNRSTPQSTVSPALAVPESIAHHCNGRSITA
jgi:hypothetical protein